MDKRATFLFLFLSFCGVSFSQSWQWALSGNCANASFANDVVVDNSGTIYAIGDFADSVFTFGSAQVSSGLTGGVFVSKIGSAGVVSWIVCSSGSSYDRGHAICVDYLGYIYVTGSFTSDTLHFGNFFLENQGGNDVFIAKIDWNGNVLWLKSCGGSLHEVGYAITIDASGNLFVAGNFTSPTLVAGSFTSNNLGSWDIFICRLTSTGQFTDLMTYGSANDETPTSIDVDGSGNLYVAGYYMGSLTIGSFPLSNSGSADIFIFKLTPALSVSWVKRFGGSIYECPNDLDVGQDGTMVVAGQFSSPTLIIGSDTLHRDVGLDACLFSLDSAGTPLWTKYVGGNNSDACNAVTYDASGNILAGYFTYSDTLVFETDTIFRQSNYLDSYVLVTYDQNGNELCNAVLSAGGSYIQCASIAPGSFVVSGAIYGSELIFGSDTLYNYAQFGAYLARFDCTLASITSNSTDSGFAVAYPNPASGMVIIHSDYLIEEVVVYDISGREILIQSCYRKETELNVDCWEQGLYLIDIKCTRGREFKKIIVE